LGALIEFKQVSANFKVRTTLLNGEPGFVAKDVAESLGYNWHRGLMEHVPEEWKGVSPIDSLGGSQNMQVLTEQGLYFFLARSDKPSALPFQKWIAGEVLPSIRKTGAYVNPNSVKRLTVKQEQDQLKLTLANVGNNQLLKIKLLRSFGVSHCADVSYLDIWEAEELTKRSVTSTVTHPGSTEIPDALRAFIGFRKRVCALEIWQDYYKQAGEMSYSDAKQINDLLREIPGWVKYAGKLRFEKYGLQRCYVRTEDQKRKPKSNFHF